MTKTSKPKDQVDPTSTSNGENPTAIQPKTRKSILWRLIMILASLLLASWLLRWPFKRKKPRERKKPTTHGAQPVPP